MPNQVSSSSVTYFTIIDDEDRISVPVCGAWYQPGDRNIINPYDQNPSSITIASYSPVFTVEDDVTTKDANTVIFPILVSINIVCEVVVTRGYYIFTIGDFNRGESGKNGGELASVMYDSQCHAEAPLWVILFPTSSTPRHGEVHVDNYKELQLINMRIINIAGRLLWSIHTIIKTPYVISAW
jgi:hypothetical protein